MIHVLRPVILAIVFTCEMHMVFKRYCKSYIFCDNFISLIFTNLVTYFTFPRNIWIHTRPPIQFLPRISYFCDQNSEIQQCYAIRHSLNVWTLVLFCKGYYVCQFEMLCCGEKGILSTSTQILKSVCVPRH